MRKVICALLALFAIYSPVFALPNPGGMLGMPSAQATAARHRAEMLVEQKAAEEAAFDLAARTYSCTHKKAAAAGASVASTAKHTSTCY